MTSFDPFGRFSPIATRTIEHDPGARLGNFVPVAIVNIARAWTKGMEDVAFSDDVLRRAPFWRQFSERYYFDPQLAERLCELDLSILSDWSNAWFPYTEEHQLFWDTALPWIEKVVFPIFCDLAAEKLRPDCAVLHYRIGDIPFDRSPYYELVPYGYYEDLAKRLDSKELVILTSNALSRDPNEVWASHSYLTDARSFLEADLGIQCHVLAGRPTFDDLFTMLHAPSLFASVLSSFSYFPGLSKPRGKYLAARSRRVGFQPSWMHELEPLAHDSVGDYFDTREVIENLRCRAS